MEGYSTLCHTLHEELSHVPLLVHGVGKLGLVECLLFLVFIQITHRETYHFCWFVGWRRRGGRERGRGLGETWGWEMRGGRERGGGRSEVGMGKEEWKVRGESERKVYLEKFEDSSNK